MWRWQKKFICKQLISKSYSSRFFGVSQMQLFATYTGLRVRIRKRSRQLIGLTVVATAVSIVSIASKDETYSDIPSWRQQLFGQYENRLRMLSQPFKVFSYFSSVEKNGERFMTPYDFMRVVIPYTQHRNAILGSPNPEYNTNIIEKRDLKQKCQKYKQLVSQILKEHLSGNSNICICMMQRLFRLRPFISKDFHYQTLRDLNCSEELWEEINQILEHGSTFPFENLIDADNNGMINFSEFCFYMTLLAIPQKDIKTAFQLLDRDGSGTLDRNEYHQVIEAFRRYIPENTSTKNLLNTHRKVENTSLDTIFFSNVDGTQGMSISDFCGFVKNLRQSLHKMEFLHYAEPIKKLQSDMNEAKVDVLRISPFSFGLFLVAHAPAKSQKRLLNRLVKRLGNQKNPKETNSITLEEFLDFQIFLLCQDELLLAISSILINSGDDEKIGLSKDEFRQAYKKALSTKSSEYIGLNNLGQTSLDTIFVMFDTNEDGRVSVEEVTSCLQSRYHKSLAERRHMGIMDTFHPILEYVKQTIFNK